MLAYFLCSYFCTKTDVQPEVATESLTVNQLRCSSALYCCASTRASNRVTARRCRFVACKNQLTGSLHIQQQLKRIIYCLLIHYSSPQQFCNLRMLILKQFIAAVHQNKRKKFRTNVIRIFREKTCLQTHKT